MPSGSNSGAIGNVVSIGSGSDLYKTVAHLLTVLADLKPANPWVA
jgi:hypothetical protein